MSQDLLRRAALNGFIGVQQIPPVLLGFLGDERFHWAMPEVLALGVVVSVFKVRDVVNVRVGPGFWCYLATALMLFLALR